MNLQGASTPPVYRARRGDLLEHVLLAQQAHGDLFHLRVASSGYFVACHPQLARDILITQKDIFTKGGERQTRGLPAVLGQGLLTVSDYDSWFSQRRVLQPVFHARQLESWTSKIIAATERLLERWSLGPEALDLTAEMLRLGEELMYELLFSVSAEQVVAHPLNVPLSLVLANAKQVRGVNAKNDAVIYKLIAERRLSAPGQTFGDITSDDILGLLLAARDADTGAAMTDKQLRDELLTLLAAGHETTAYALSWTLYLLFTAPEVLKTLQRELEQGSPKSLENLPYLDAVFKEGLRLYPTIPATPRSAQQDTELGGFLIPKGSRVFVSVYAVHRHPDFWKAPNVFKPERFLDGSAQLEAYIPFGLGRRFCLGRNLARLQAKLVLALLVKKLELNFGTEPPRNRLAVSLSPRDPLLAKLAWR